MNINEDKVGEEMIPELHGGGYLLGDGEYDANSVFDAAGPRAISCWHRGRPGYGVGAPLPEPVRLRCIELMRSGFGRGVFACRGAIERTFGALTSFGGGLFPLPSWVRHLNRVWLWVSAKLVINGVRIMALRKGLAA